MRICWPRSYIEVWPPHDRFRHLDMLVARARERSGKHVVLAAYLDAMHQGGVEAEEGVLYTYAVIAAAGGFHLLVGEGNASR